MPWEVTLGRALAYAAHPLLGWRRLSRRRRAVLVAAYGAASYAVTLGVLLML
jgi:hypothetical protein